MEKGLRAFLVPVVVVLAIVAAVGPALSDGLVDDFENPAEWPAWSFVTAPGCPGAAGGLERVAGAGRNGSTALRLSFDFTGGGCRVGARRSLVGFSAAGGVSFWLAGAVPGTRLAVRLTDETGQVFETYLPMQSEDGRRWMRYGILTAAGGRWSGGAADGVFHGEATALEVLLDAGYGVHPTGAIRLDDVRALSGWRLSLDPFTAGRRAPELFRGRLRDRLGVNVDPVTLNAARLDRAAAAGFGWVRTDLDWSTVERVRGRYDFSPYDSLLDALEARGLRALLVLDYFNPLYCPEPGCDEHTGPATAEQRKAFTAFAAAVAAHFEGRDDVSLEVWNEPDTATFWRPEPDPVAYGQLAAAVMSSVRQVNAAMPVAVGATSGVDVDFLDAAMAAADLSGAGWISVHPYRSFAPESLNEDVALLREIVAARTGRSDIPVISSEWGYTTRLFEGDRTEVLHRQAVAAVRELLAAQLARLPLAVWYDLSDDCPDPTEWECGFGLLEADGETPKPAWDAVAAMSRNLPAGRVRVSSCGQPPALYCLSFRAVDGVTAVLWSGQDGADLGVELVREPGLEIRDLFGRPVASGVFDGGELRLREEDGPVYLHIPVGSRRPRGRRQPLRP